MKFWLGLLFFWSSIVQCRNHGYLADVKSNGAAMLGNDDNFRNIMGILQGNLTTAVDQTMDKLDSILVLKGNREISDELRSKITDFKEELTLAFEDDLKKLIIEFKDKRSEKNGPLSVEEQYEFSNLVKVKWKETLSLRIAKLGHDLPPWVESVIRVWYGIEQTVVENIRRFKKFIHRSYPMYQDTCSLPKSVLVGSNTISSALSRTVDGEISKRSAGIKVIQFIGAVVGGILLATASIIIITLYFVAYIIGSLIAALFGVLGIYN